MHMLLGANSLSLVLVLGRKLIAFYPWVIHVWDQVYIDNIIISYFLSFLLINIRILDLMWTLSHIGSFKIIYKCNYLAAKVNNKYIYI